MISGGVYILSSDNKFLEQSFEKLNKLYFNSSLPKVIITIQSSPKSNGYITVNEVWKDNIHTYHEINISAEHISRPIENVLATLVHEMVHLYCMVNNIKDVSNGGRYHNRRFKEEAEKRDLIIEKVKYIGYSKTSPSERFIRVLKENGLYENINHYRNTETLTSLPTGKKKSSTRKYVCTICGNTVRATKDLNIICGDCMQTMVKVE